MRQFSAIVGVVALLAGELAFAAAAMVTSATGSVQVQTGSAAPRALRAGDGVEQGETVSTGAASSVVLRFEDGQVVALSANARMAVSTYAYNAQSPEKGNVLLSLIGGGMRAISGLIGRRAPSQVSYRAASATIGIRGTDVTIATAAGNVVVTVTEGVISFTFGGQTIIVSAGQGVNAKSDGKFQQAAAEEIAKQLEGTADGKEILDAINGLKGLESAIQEALRGGSASGGTTSTPGPNAPQAPVGGGTASQS